MIEYLIYAACVALGYAASELFHRRKAKGTVTTSAAGGPGEE